VIHYHFLKSSEVKMTENLTTFVSSKTKTVEISRDKRSVIIGERINPTGRRKVQAALEEGNFDIIRQDAIKQVAAGADILDVNAGVPGADEPTLLKQAISAVMEVTDVPLSIDSNDKNALAAGLAVYEGKALVNSVNGEEHSLQAVLPQVKEYGAAVIGLCMDDDGIPETAEARLVVAAKIIERAGKLGIPLEDVIIDPLTLTMGADSMAGKVMLRTIELVIKRPQLHQCCFHCNGHLRRCDLSDYQSIGHRDQNCHSSRRFDTRTR
jgi:5-methyltetrahydrofolate--homocysteine methyltransferase